MSEQSQGPGWWQATDGQWYPPRWEYRLETLSLLLKSGNQAAAERMNELGRQGWEAVGLAGEPHKSGMVLFKRPLGG